MLHHLIQRLSYSPGGHMKAMHEKRNGLTSTKDQSE
jgi:hypothetical protein